MIETLLRIQIILICLMLLIVAYAATFWRSPFGVVGKSFTLRLYHRFIIATAIMLVSDVLGCILDGKSGTVVHILMLVLYTVYYSFHTVPIVCYILYADGQLNRNPERTRNLGKPLWIISIAIATTALVSPFTGWLFHINAENVYMRGDYFILFAVVQFTLVGLSFIPVLTGKHRPNPKAYWTLVFFPSISVIGGIIQYMYYGLVVIWPVTTVFLVAAALNIQKAQMSIDHLTGISNRMSFDENLEQCIHPANQHKEFGCILMDLDGFKNINDTLGHYIGDQALEDIASILRKATGHDDVVARYGGDEFAILLPDSDADRLMNVVKRIERELELFNQMERRPYSLSLSMGYCIYNLKKFSTSKDFIAYLDAAMYTHKRSKLVPKISEPIKESSRINE